MILIEKKRSVINIRHVAHDMFSPQPVQDASIFIVRAVMHDWSDEYCIKILSQLRAAATPTTQLVVIDNIIPYACDDSTQSLDIPGARDIRPDAPAPLLPNFGAARLMTYYIDISVGVHVLFLSAKGKLIVLLL